MAEKASNILFLCTGNTARSILAEGILRKLGAPRFSAYSAGSQPKGAVNPFALKVLAAHGFPADGYRSKSWLEFSAADAPRMDFIITVCDSAAGEACPLWPGQPVSAHWGVPDPAAVEGTENDKIEAFEQAFRVLAFRVQEFLALPFADLGQHDLRTAMQRIGSRTSSVEAKVQEA